VKALFPILSTLVVVSSCVNYDGNFRAEQKLKLKHTTVFGNTKTRTLPAGQYKTSFEVTSGKKLKFTFKGKDTVEVKMKVPDSLKLPETDGTFFFMSEETGQNYDIKGDLKTDYSSSGIIDAVETCSYQRMERQCAPVCSDTAPVVDKNDEVHPARRREARRGNPRPDPRRCTVVCRNVSVTRYGNQNVRYRINYTNKTLHLSMNQPNTDKIAATYRGHDQSSYRSYEYRGRCR